MRDTEELLRLIEKEHIILEHYAMNSRINGMYTNMEGLCLIVVNEGIQEDERLYRSVLAEELGHHFTSTGNGTPVQHMGYTERLTYERCENIALRWAAEYMVPDVWLINTLSGSREISLPWAANRFGITEPLMLKKLECMAARKHLWPLNDGRMLMLTNLPDVYLFESMEMR